MTDSLILDLQSRAKRAIGCTKFGSIVSSKRDRNPSSTVTERESHLQKRREKVNQELYWARLLIDAIMSRVREPVDPA